MKFSGEKPTQEGKIIKIDEALNGDWFTGNHSGLLALLESSLGNEVNRKVLIDILEKRLGEPVPLSQIIRVSDSFNSLQKQIEGKLTEKDIKWINSMIKYFENWFYNGNWTHVPKNKEDNPNTYAYFSVPAGIINMFTKIKDTQEYTDKITEFDRVRLQDLLKKIEDFEKSFMSQERLTSIINNNPTEEEKQATENTLKYRDTIKDLFKKSVSSVKKEFHEYGPDQKRNSGSKAQDLYFMKTCLIAATKLEKEKSLGENGIFIPDLAIFEPPQNNYEIYDMSSGKDASGLSRMHYHPLRLPFCKFAVKYLESLKG